MQLVKPNFLGTKKEFKNQFANPISNGQFINSSDRDVHLMKERAHILRYNLKDCIQRFDYHDYLKPVLPEKFAYAVLLRLSPLQIKLYQYYMEKLYR